jgi:hypothetical protein
MLVDALRISIVYVCVCVCVCNRDHEGDGATAPPTSAADRFRGGAPARPGFIRVVLSALNLPAPIAAALGASTGASAVSTVVAMGSAEPTITIDYPFRCDRAWLACVVGTIDQSSDQWHACAHGCQSERGVVPTYRFCAAGQTSGGDGTPT